MTRSKFCLVSSVIDYKTQLALDGMDLLEIGPVDACKRISNLTKLCGKLFNQIVLLKDKKKAKESFEACEKKKKNRFQVEGNRRAHAQWHPDIRMPRLHVSKEHRVGLSKKTS